MSETRKDGGPAFPQNVSVGPDGEVYYPLESSGYGMSLRDWFAGQALVGTATGVWQDHVVVERAYCIADAMIEAREK